MSKTTSFVHNVPHPPIKAFHCPDIGGTYAPRFIDVSQANQTALIAWHAYDPVTYLDQIVVQRFADGNPSDAPMILSSAPGRFGRPCVSTLNAAVADVLWIADGQQLCHRSCRAERWLPVKVVSEVNGWLRDATVHHQGDRVLCAVIECDGRQDHLVLLQLTDHHWREIGRASFDGLAARPDMATDGSGRLFITCDHYDGNRYRVQVYAFSESCCQLVHTFTDPSRNTLFSRITADHRGGLWLCYLSEQVVAREGVVNRAVAVRVARLGEDEQWVDVAGPCGQLDVVRLYEGLLPRKRYFGYAGLRRNPRLIATDDGYIHLAWEAQRSEEQDWDNVLNGRLLAMSFDGADWSDVYLWRDGGICFACDHRAVHLAECVTFFCKGEHRNDGADFVSDTINPAVVPITAKTDPSGWVGWKPFIPERSTSRPQIQCEGEMYQLYFGDFHSHSVFSPDAEGYPDELYLFARDVAGIDFCGITDNDFYPHKALLAGEVDYQQHLRRRLEEPGRFLPFNGYEWTFHRNDPAETYNHRSIIYLNDDAPIIRRIEAEGHTEAAFRQHLAAWDVFAHAHHAQYELLELRQEANVEVTSGWAINIEKSSCTHDHLDSGFRVGFSGASDSHRSVPGLGGALLAVWATELTREALIDALRRHRCYATMGNRIMIDFRLNGRPMGGVVREPDKLEFQIHVTSNRPLKRVSIVSDGRVCHDFDVAGRTLKTNWTGPQLRAGNHWYYLRVDDGTPYHDHPHNVCQAVGPLAWSSPIWAECAT